MVRDGGDTGCNAHPGESLVANGATKQLGAFMKKDVPSLVVLSLEDGFANVT